MILTTSQRERHPVARTEPTILLAAMHSGDHIQIGKATTHDAAYAAWEAHDADLKAPHGRGQRMHAIGGEPVRFYRLRQDNPIDITPVRTVPVRYVRKTGFVGSGR